MKFLNILFLTLLIVGGLNWGSVGLFGVDLVGALFGGTTSMLSRIIFTVVGLAAVWSFTFFTKVDENAYRVSSARN